LRELRPPRPPKSIVHHYIPEFLLRGWVGEDGRLERFTRPFGNTIHVKRVYPSQVGFERRLYDFAPYDEKKFAGLELAYFQPIDDLAAKAKDRLLTNIEGEWSPELRSSWSRFLMSLVHRDPESLSIFRRRLAKILARFSPSTQAHWESIRAPDDPLNYLDKLAEDPAYHDTTALRLLPSVIDNGNLGLFINRMVWGVMTLKSARRTLLVSDYPLVISNGIKNDNGHLALALGPSKLFVACYRKELFDHLTNAQSADETVFNYNRCIVQRAKRFVGSYDTRQRRFIENRFGAKPLNILEPVFDQLDAEGHD
jgi:hypothetical protein